MIAQPRRKMPSGQTLKNAALILLIAALAVAVVWMIADLTLTS